MTRYRYFKINISLPFYGIPINTKVFAIENNLTLVLLGMWYSLICLLLGCLTGLHGIKRTFLAIHTNMTGGVDCTTEVDEGNYDKKTNYIWNNLLQKNKDKISKEETEALIALQDEFEKSDKEIYSRENIDFLIINLSGIGMHKVKRDEIGDFFDAILSYKRNVGA